MPSAYLIGQRDFRTVNARFTNILNAVLVGVVPDEVAQRRRLHVVAEVGRQVVGRACADGSRIGIAWLLSFVLGVPSECQ